MAKQTTSEDKYLFTKFERLQSYKQEKRAIELFKEYFDHDFTFRSVIVGNFLKDLEWLVPEGAPKFEAARSESTEPTSIHRVFRQGFIAALVKPRGQKFNINNQVKAEKKFIGVLEGLHQKDADILVAMKDKKLTELYPIITRSFAMKAVGKKLDEV